MHNEIARVSLNGITNESIFFFFFICKRLIVGIVIQSIGSLRMICEMRRLILILLIYMWNDVKQKKKKVAELMN